MPHEVLGELYYSEAEVCEITGLKPRTLSNLHSRREGPPRTARKLYPAGPLKAWIERGLEEYPTTRPAPGPRPRTRESRSTNPLGARSALLKKQ
jgi:hypothetical protein